MRIATGTRDEEGNWVPDDPAAYETPLDLHGIFPWSVLQQDSQAWRARRRYWGDIDDTTPRMNAGGMISSGRHGRISGGISRFDPVLAELLIEWWCPPGSRILDPFAGGPVRGVVADRLGREYVGIDLSRAQVEANRRFHAPRAQWVHGDAATEVPLLDSGFGFLISCPPYHNRERYSDDPADLSAMRWPAFLDAYQRIITASVAALDDDAFIAWVISDVRDSRGHLRSLPAKTVTAFEAAGASLTNELILVGPAGLGAKATRPAWEACRTTRRRHQIVQIYIKGDRRKAARKVQRAHTE